MRLSTFKNMLEKFNLGEPHETLSGNDWWHSEDAQHLADREAATELAQAGLLRGNGRLDEDFLDAVQLQQRATVEYYTTAKIDGQVVTLRAARTGHAAVVVTSDAETISIWPTRADTPNVELIRLLPPTPPAQVHSMSCARADYTAMATGRSTRTGPQAGEARRMIALMNGPRAHAGQLYAGVRDRLGHRRVTEQAPWWIDTDQGRILLTTDKNNWVTVVGAGAGELATTWDRLAAALSEAR